MGSSSHADLPVADPNCDSSDKFAMSIFQPRRIILG